MAIKSIDTRYKENLSASNTNMQNDLSENDATHAKQSEKIKKQYNTEIEENKDTYDDASRENEIQKYINEREVAENNANLGLTDSGLNKTQQQAVQLSAEKTETDIQTERKKMVDTLTEEMNALLEDVETQRATQEKSIRSAYEKDAYDSAVDSYKADVEAAEKAAEKAAAAEKEQADSSQKAYTQLVSELLNENIDSNQKLKLIYAYNAKYGFESHEQAKAIFGYIGLDVDIDSQDNVTIKENKVESTPSYYIRKTKDTMNGFLGIGNWVNHTDTNDTYEIVDANTNNVIKTISDIDDFTSLTKTQKKTLSNLTENEYITTGKLFADDEYQLKLFKESIS